MCPAQLFAVSGAHDTRPALLTSCVEPAVPSSRSPSGRYRMHLGVVRSCIEHTFNLEQRRF
jgi:hypothetical protein